MKLIPSLIVVLVITSLFVPAVVATENTTAMSSEDALNLRVMQGLTEGHMEGGSGGGYRYDGGQWIIYTDEVNFFGFSPDTDEKRIKLLEFIMMVDETYRQESVMMTGMLTAIGGFLCIILSGGVAAPVVGGVIGIIGGAVTGYSMHGASVCSERALALAEEMRQ